MTRRVIGVTERNVPVGQDHPLAELTDREVELMRDLREREGWTYLRLAAKFEVSVSLVAMVCRYERRVARPARFRSVDPSRATAAPVPPAPSPRAIRAAERRRAFLDALATTGIVTKAFAASGLDSATAYALRRTDPEFAAAWTAALERFPKGWAHAPVHRPGRVAPRIAP